MLNTQTTLKRQVFLICCFRLSVIMRFHAPAFFSGQGFLLDHHAQTLCGVVETFA